MVMYALKNVARSCANAWPMRWPITTHWDGDAQGIGRALVAVICREAQAQATGLDAHDGVVSRETGVPVAAKDGNADFVFGWRGGVAPVQRAFDQVRQQAGAAMRLGKLLACDDNFQVSRGKYVK